MRNILFYLGYASVFLFSILFLTQCVHVNSISLTPIPQDRKNPVKTQISKLMFLGFNFDNDYVDSAVLDLKRQCPHGKISGILTKDENIDYFLFFVWRKQITAMGYCSHSSPISKKSTPGRATSSEPATETSEVEIER